MRPLTLNDFCDAEGSTLTLTDLDPEDEPLPLDGDDSTSTEEKQLVVKEDGTNSIDNGASHDESVDLESR